MSFVCLIFFYERPSRITKEETCILQNYCPVSRMYWKCFFILSSLSSSSHYSSTHSNRKQVVFRQKGFQNRKMLRISQMHSWTLSILSYHLWIKMSDNVSGQPAFVTVAAPFWIRCHDRDAKTSGLESPEDSIRHLLAKTESDPEDFRKGCKNFQLYIVLQKKQISKNSLRVGNPTFDSIPLLIQFD